MDGGQSIQSELRKMGALVALALLCALPAPAMAQEGAQALLEMRPAIDADELALSPEDSAIIDKALALDSASFAGAPHKPLRLPALTGGKGLDLSRTDRPDGSGTVVVKKTLTTEWDANVGADLGLAPHAQQGYNRDNPLGVTRNDRGSGAAWASLGVTRFATVDARVDPDNEQGRIGTTFKQSLPVGDKFAVSVQSRYSITETLGQPQAAASDIQPRVWGSENIARLDILSTGTTLGAGLSAASTDPVTHNTLSAEQKIYGPLGVTTAVTDLGRPGENKSLRARLKLTW